MKKIVFFSLLILFFLYKTQNVFAYQDAFTVDKIIIEGKIKQKNFKNIDKNSSTIDKDKDYLKFFSKKNMVLLEKRENYLFKKFKYKKLSKKNYKFNLDY